MSFNELFFPVVTSAILSQGIKVALHFLNHQKVDLSLLLFEPGGMPSTHAAMATALTTTLYLIKADTSVFAVALLFSLIVMADAVGVRREAGETARRINQMIQVLRSVKQKGVTKVREVLGHTPLQVAGGIVLGMLVALFFFNYF
ncbi:MAG: divergent PAP2 family protein [Candidatus Woesearchaeota archaeon]|nr:divergent PAP2 family protein [Candidatus Woesearchaeota archaeon]